MTERVPTGKAQRREAAREKARVMREHEQRRRRHRRGTVVAVAAVAVLVLVVGIGVAVQSARSGVSTAAAGPSSVTDAGGVLVGNDGAAVAVRIYVDYQCPACRAFEQESADYLQQLVDDGTASVEHVPVAILDRFSSTRYATRAAGAAYCAIDADPSSFTAVNEALFAAQPPEGTAGLSDDELGDVVTGAGAPEAVRGCITGGRFEGHVATVTEEASKAGLQGTPTVTVDGRQLTTASLQTLQAAVEVAQAS